MRKSKTIWIAMAVAIAVLALAGVAVAATDAASPAASPAAAGTQCGVTDPDALAELQGLRTDFFEARQAWFDKYGDDRLSDAAQSALQQLRDDHIAKVQSVLDKYGIDATAGARAGQGGHGGGMGGGMMGGMGMAAWAAAWAPAWATAATAPSPPTERSAFGLRKVQDRPGSRRASLAGPRRGSRRRRQLCRGSERYPRTASGPPSSRAGTSVLRLSTSETPPIQVQQHHDVDERLCLSICLDCLR